MLGTSLNIYPKTVHVLEFEKVVTAFSVAFATSILREGPERAHSVDDAFDVFFELFRCFLPRFSVQFWSAAKRGRSETDTSPSPVQCLMNADDAAILLVQLDKRDLDVEILKVIRKWEAEAGTVHIVAFESFFLPNLEALIATGPWISERVTRYGKLFRTTLTMYAMRFVQIEPQAGRFTRSNRGCGCSLCRQFDHFLVNASQQPMRFPVSRGRRQHLHQRLPCTKIKHVTDRRGVETLVVTKPSTPSLAKA